MSAQPGFGDRAGVFVIMSESTEQSAVKCHECGSPHLEISAGYERLRRVTSDCKPWPSGGGLGRCPNCGLVETLVTPEWQRETEEIYRAYTIYHQSGGSEQQVFRAERDAGKPRSAQIIEALGGAISVPEKGRLLDVGCGNGSFLRAWSRVLPNWSLAGFEVNDKYRKEVESIPGVEQLHVGSLEDVAGPFDFISLIHVLEHIPGPSAFLRGLKSKLSRDGRILIEVPDCSRNRYMLLVADHCSHFSPALLAGVLKSAGYEVIEATHTWVVKEVSALGRPVLGDTVTPAQMREIPADSVQVFQGWRFLEEIAGLGRSLRSRENLGIFGTAIAATWLDSEMEGVARFFVDEDTQRMGKTHLNRPILAPDQVPAGATVIVPLPEPLAGKISARLSGLGRGLQVIVP